MSKTIRSLFLFGAPIFVGVLNLFHPTHFDQHAVYAGLHTLTVWWITLHVLNLFGFSALGLAAYLLLQNQHGIASNIARAALMVFVPTYAGFDSIIGIGTGILMRYGNSIPPGELATLKSTINAYWNSNIATMLAIVGSVAWSTTMGTAAVSFSTARRAATLVLAVLAGVFTGWGYAAGLSGTWAWWLGVAIIVLIGIAVLRPALPPTLLILAGLFFGTSHVVPFGPLGMSCLIAAAALLQWAPNQIRVQEAAPSQT